jgi:hypothetical protein
MPIILFSEEHEVDPSMKPSNQRLVASKFKYLSKIDRFLPLLAKAVKFTIEEFSTRTKKVYTLL